MRLVCLAVHDHHYSGETMIRAFVTGWQLVGNQVLNPIVEQGESVVSGPFACSMVYPDADANGLPDGPHVLIFVESDSPTIEDLDTLDGVYMFPPHAFDTPLADVPQSTKDEVLGLCASEGWMPTAPLFTAQTYGDCLKLLASHFQAGFTSFGRYEVEKAAEFG